MNNYLLKGKKVLITAGPTREYIDPVRYISNHTGGKIGYELAAFMLQQGAEVFLVSGPVKVELKHPLLTIVKATTGCEMYLACCRFFEDVDIAIFTAAVSDYKPKQISQEKVLKEEDAFSIKMVKNIDIAGAFAKLKRCNQLTIGFNMEPHCNVKQAISKLERKNFDMLVFNNVDTEDDGYDLDENCISILKSDLSIEQITNRPRTAIVKDLIMSITSMLKQKQLPVSLYHHTHTTNTGSQSLSA
jgi:phosphopantothenoylcysteine decarboxylase / phosphopantothenate---cysteine ligase